MLHRRNATLPMERKVGSTRRDVHAAQKERHFSNEKEGG
jgi:hypothetical protein